MRDAWEHTRLELRQFFGLPNGFSLWIKLERTAKLKWVEGGLALVNSLIAGASVAYTFYLTEKTGPAVHEYRAGIALALWSWWTLYESRRLSDLMHQAKVLKEVERGKFKPEASRIFAHFSHVARSLLANAIVLSAAFGLESAVTEMNIERNIWNTTVHLFARGWIDAWFDKRKPTIKESGAVIVEVEKGQWQLGSWIMVNSLWNLFYMFGKNVSLLGLGGWADVGYYILGGVGVLKIAYDERFNIQNKFQRLVAAFRGVAVFNVCESLLTRRKPD
jgi:hypothetical protein